jgi:DNA-binding transcriptional ArsR family regulator
VEIAHDPFGALADAHRRAIVEALAQGEHSVKEIADELPISRPAVSRHLRLLKQAGLVTDRPEGTRRIYSLQRDGVDAVHEYMRRVWGEAATRYKLVTENLEEQA